MPEIITPTNNSLKSLEDRLRHLAMEKSYLQLVNDLMIKLSTVSGVENTAENIARLILENIGGSSVAIYYLIDNEVFYADVYGKKIKLETVDDPLVCKVFESHKFMEVAHDFERTRMLTPEFTKASTWATPLMVGKDCIGVLKMDDMLMAAHEIRRQLEPFLNYAALVLKNEMLGYTKLKKTHDQLSETNKALSIEITERQQAEEALRISKKELEQRVLERTAELRSSNERLQVELSERRRAEENLTRMNERFFLAVRAAHLGVYDWDIRKDELVWDEGMYALYGLHREDFTGAYEAWLKGVHPDDRERSNEVSKRAQRGEQEYDTEFRVIWPNNSIHYLKAYGQFTRNADGEPLRMTGINYDITDHKRAEESLRRLNRELRAISICNQILIRAEDEQTLLTDICRIINHEAGYPLVWVGYVEHDREKSIRPVAWAGFDTDYVAKARLSWSEDLDRGRGPAGIAVRSGEPVPIQDITVDPRMAPWRDGALTHGYRSAIALPLKDEKAAVFGVLLIYSPEPHVFNVEEIELLQELAGDLAFGINVVRTRNAQKTAEETIRQLNVDLTATLQAIPDLLFELDQDGTYINIWARNLELLVKEKDILLGHTVSDMLPSEAAEIVMESIREADEKGSSYGSIISIDLPGGTRWFELSTSKKSDVDTPSGHFMMLSRDITARKLAEAQVEHLKNYLSNIIDSMPSVLIGMDTNLTITQWNLQAEAFTGLSAAEAIGRPISELLPEFSPWVTGIEAKISQDHPFFLEKIIIIKKGERRLYDLMLYPLATFGREDAVLRIEDVTEQARIQELMIQTEKMISLGGLAAGMAHEINNPLGIITQAAQNIERRILPDLPANRHAAEEMGLDLKKIQAYFEKRRITEFMGSIREASFRASQIITNMLQFSRQADSTIQAGLLSQVVDRALELAGSDYDLKKKYDFRSIEILRDYEEVSPVSMMAVEMEQVFLNLFKNAAQAMMANPPERKPRITIRLRRENRFVLLEVEDNGPGMTEEIRRRVFEPFFTTKDPGIGTGLGLSVSYMIVTQNHKGLMEVESTPGRGTCFRVRLPVGGNREGI